MFPFLLNKYPGMEYGKRVLYSEGNCQLLPQRGRPILHFNKQCVTVPITPPTSTWNHWLLFYFFFTFEIYSPTDLLRYKSQAITFAGFKDTVWLTSVLVYSYVTITTINIQIHSQPFHYPPKVPSACSLQLGKSNGLWPCPRSPSAPPPAPIPYNLPFTEFHINGAIQWVGFSLSVFWDPAILLCAGLFLLSVTIWQYRSIAICLSLCHWVGTVLFPAQNSYN